MPMIRAVLSISMGFRDTEEICSAHSWEYLGERVSSEIVTWRGDWHCLRRQSRDEEAGIVFGDSHMTRRLALSAVSFTKGVSIWLDTGRWSCGGWDCLEEEGCWRQALNLVACSSMSMALCSCFLADVRWDPSCAACFTCPDIIFSPQAQGHGVG